ncbi:MAG: transcriptional regulator [Rhizobiaceae bacterium]
MKTAMIEIRHDEDAAFAESLDRARSAFKSHQPSDPLATFTFSSAAQLFSVFTANRFALIERLQKTGPVSIRALARSLERDIRRVHDDVAVLLEWGIIEKNDVDKIYVPFDVIHAAFDIKAAA